MKRTLIFRFLAASLAILMMSGILVACGNAGAGGNNTQAQTTAGAESVEQTESIYDKDGYLLDEIPADIDLKNVTITVLYWDDVENHEFPVFESNGDTVDEAILEANAKTEERLKIKFDYMGTPGNNNNAGAYVTKVDATQKSGDPIDIYAAYSKTLGSVAVKGYCQNLLEQDDKIDFNKPWWPSSLIEEATIKNKLYFCAGDLSTNLLYMMYVVFFNKEVIDNFNLENPYDLVRANEWTYEKMFTMASSLTAPGSPDMVYGLCTGSNVHLDPFFYAAGLHTTERDSEGTPIISPSWGGERAVDVVNSVWTFLHSGVCTWDKTNIYAVGGDDVFIQNHGLFEMNRARFASSKLGDASFDYGVVPVPKYTADQDHFATCMGFPFTLYAIALNAPHTGEAAWTLECLGSYGHRIITPALYDISMKERYSKDADSAQMYDIVRQGATFELGRLYADDFGKQTYSLFRTAISGATQPNYAGNFSAASKVLNNYMSMLLKAFD